MTDDIRNLDHGELVSQYKDACQRLVRKENAGRADESHEGEVEVLEAVLIARLRDEEPKF